MEHGEIQLATGSGQEALTIADWGIKELGN
jgi:hypothetical protein